MKKAIIGGVSLLILSLSSMAYAAEDDMMMKDDLMNVTAGAEIRGIVTSNEAAGHAKASFVDGEFMMHAEFEGLTSPLGDDFYEGWLVRKTPFAFISTGELTLEDGKYINHFISTTNYSDYTEYVLTLEPNDGDDAPADHIFEGMVMLHNGDMMDDSMMKKDDMMKADMMDDNMTNDSVRTTAIKGKIRSRISNFSDVQLKTVLERVESLQSKLPTLGLTAEREAVYVELLDALVDVINESI